MERLAEVKALLPRIETDYFAILDLLLSIPELHAIQWVPGAGREEVAR